MPVQLMKLRGVPEDELADVYELLDSHDIDFYETSAGNWGISLPALWLSREEQYPEARALLDAYQAGRYRQARADFEASRAEGKARTWRDLFLDNPLRFILYIALVAGLIYISTVPWWGLGSGN